MWSTSLSQNLDKMRRSLTLLYTRNDYNLTFNDTDTRGMSYIISDTGQPERHRGEDICICTQQRDRP